MKNLKPSHWLVLILIVGYLIYSNLGTILDGNIDKKMHRDLDPNNAGGDKIVTYYVDEDRYSKDYIPFGYQTGKAEEVGAILRITKEPVTQSYSGGFQARASALIVELVDCSTGEVMGRNGFYPQFPSTYKVGSTVVKVEESRVRNWVNQEWAEYLAENQ